MAWMQEIDRCSQSHQFFGKPCSLYQSLAVSLISEKEVDLRSALSVEMAILDTSPLSGFLLISIRLKFLVLLSSHAILGALRT